MMKQEDVLRELGLLPVWQLRVSSAEAVPSETATLEPTKASEAVHAIVSVPEECQAVTVVYRCIASVDGQWLFVLRPQQHEAAEILLQNMLKAVGVKVGKVIEKADLAAFVEGSAKVVVVMGEAVAQHLLASSAPLAALRGQAHFLHRCSIIATYAPEDLLLRAQDKANAWADLCLAKQTVANLSSNSAPLDV